MNSGSSPSQSTAKKLPPQIKVAITYYDILGLNPSASVIEIRRAYRDLSKKYHPDTTELPAAIATNKFQKLNQAYAVLSHPDKRTIYDLQIGYSRWNVIQTAPDLDQPSNQQKSYPNSAYLDPNDRPLSAGEIFVLFILILTFMGCLALVICIAIIRGDSVWQMSELNPPLISLINSFLVLKV